MMQTMFIHKANDLICDTYFEPNLYCPRTQLLVTSIITLHRYSFKYHCRPTPTMSGKYRVATMHNYFIT